MTRRRLKVFSVVLQYGFRRARGNLALYRQCYDAQVISTQQRAKQPIALFLCTRRTGHGARNRLTVYRRTGHWARNRYDRNRDITLRYASRRYKRQRFPIRPVQIARPELRHQVT